MLVYQFILFYYHRTACEDWLWDEIRADVRSCLGLLSDLLRTDEHLPGLPGQGHTPGSDPWRPLHRGELPGKFGVRSMENILSCKVMENWPKKCHGNRKYSEKVMEKFWNFSTAYHVSCTRSADDSVPIGLLQWFGYEGLSVYVLVSQS